jgi:hypothetical protein
MVFRKNVAAYCKIRTKCIYIHIYIHTYTHTHTHTHTYIYIYIYIHTHTHTHTHTHAHTQIACVDKMNVSHSLKLPKIRRLTTLNKL